MAFFQFGRRSEFSKEFSLSDIPVFSSLTPAEQKIIEKKVRLTEYKRGDLVYEENTAPEAFYVVLSGSFRLYQKGKPNRPERTMIYFHRGDHFSEASLLTGRMHSASVEAARDGVLLRLDKDDFLKFVNDFPTISIFLNRSLGYRLTKMSSENKNPHEVRITSFYSKIHSVEALECWLDMAASFTKETKRKVIVVDFVHPLSSFLKNVSGLDPGASFDAAEKDVSSESEVRSSMSNHRDGFHYLHVVSGKEQIKDEKKASALITFLTYRFDYVLMRLHEELDNFTLKMLKISDGVYFYTSLSEIDEARQAVQAFQQNVGFSKSEIRVLMPERPEHTGATIEAKEDSLGVSVFSVLPSRENQAGRYQQTLTYLAKEFAGTLLGLALGSGAAYGLAHIGVLKVLKEQHINVDIVAGSSIGSLVGGLWASGYEPEELEKIACDLELKNAFFRLLGFRDMSAAHLGFFKGNQITRWLESYLGDKTFRDLKFPLKIIAANLFTSESVLMETGRVVDAIRASISIPGIFRPVKYKDTYLIDGGVVDPLPVQVLSSMGVKKIIAVNVLPGSKERIERNKMMEQKAIEKAAAAAQKPFWRRWVAQGTDKVYHRYAVNIFNVIMSTIQFLEYEIAEKAGSQADILIHPIARDAHWAEFYSAAKFIELGEQKTRDVMDEIKRLIAE